ncbi:MAG: diguanylate cyclase [Pontiellaceae bacterium]|nr:diguanylate cyclase [Pontiellaceae bacterium]
MNSYFWESFWGDFLSSAAVVLAVSIISFIVILLVTSYYRFQHVVELAEKVDADDLGTSEAEVIRVQLARYVASCSRRGISFSLALIKSGNPGERVLMDSDFTQALRAAVRHDDVVCVYDVETAALLLESESEDAEAILQRIMKTVSTSCSAVVSEGMRAAVVSYPGHGLSGRELLHAVEHGLEACSADKPIIFPEIVDEADDDEEEIEAEEQFDSAEDADDEKGLSKKEKRRRNLVLDPVTGVLNSASLTVYLQRRLNEFRQRKKEAALFCVGVNNMDYIMRFHGAAVADDLLAGVSKLLQASLRADDLIGRHEEYAFLVLSQCSLEQAAKIGKRISTLVQKEQFMSGRKTLKTTITVGVSAYPQHGRNLHHLYQAGQKVLDYSRENDIRAYAVFDPQIHDKMPSRPLKSIKASH